MNGVCMRLVCQHCQVCRHNIHYGHVFEVWLSFIIDRWGKAAGDETENVIVSTLTYMNGI